MSSFFHDLRHALRLLRRRPVFTGAALLCLALGIGGTTAVFSLVNGVLLEPMPFSDPHRLVFAANAPEDGASGWAPLSQADIVEWRHRQSVLKGVAGYRNVAVTLQEGEAPERLVGMGVTEGIFGTLGVKAVLGRTFTPEETRPGGPKVTLLTWELWQRRFGGDPDILGRGINLQGEPHTVVGVMPKGFEFPWWSDIYVPLQVDPAGEGGRVRNMRAVARLADGATLEGARAVMEGVQEALKREHPRRYEGLGVYLNAYQEEERAYHRDGLLFLMAAVGLVLLIACVNVASILLARAAGRGREMAIRTSLGADRKALGRHLLAESLLLGGLGGIGGLALGVTGRDLILALAPMPRPFWMDFGLDLRVAVFVVGTSLVTSLLFGMAPALFSARAHPGGLLRSGGDRNVSARRRWGSSLVAGEVALALALLVSGGAMVKGFRTLLDVDPGFDPEGVLTLQVTLPSAGFPGADERRALFSQAVERLGTLPGVRSVGAVQSVPLSGDFWGQGYAVEGAPPPDAGDRMIGHIRIVHGAYFRTAGIPLVRGRVFTPAEIQNGSPDIIVNEALVRRHWPGEDPIGRRIKLGTAGSDAPWRTVIGVVGNVRQNSLAEGEASPGFYLPYENAPQRSMTFFLRTDGDPTLLAGPGREALARLAPSVPVHGVRTLREYHDRATGQTRFYTWLMGAFSVVALLLTLPGVAGVVVFAVRSRVREAGIRVALGATPGGVLRRLLLEGLGPVVPGLALGAGLAYLVLRSLAASFYGVSAWDPGIYVGVGATLVGAVFLSAWLPTRRALSADPARVLQEE